ncbi:class I poly(R)-hydroxyalkanoic acid synthase [Marinospirillum insulare]|uniref:Class I poly(R)-hydroxyalkanoic acid synthase n=1 Tax=Marinospirillum insulare TaxID=217169 RepID=A0ABQ6A0E9_9GAMM|nr:class I poly(R)-hydroxyalkanoic acid synthase [Marinospirillum insulare]GLR65276.1 class I poly(R)-hydroxyalkanoic acid synthase [Marinospirillum insulare]
MTEEKNDQQPDHNPFDPAEMFEWMTEANERYQAVIQQFISQNEGGASDTSSSIFNDMGENFQQLGQQLAANPMVMFDEQMSLMQGQMQLWQNTVRELLGQKDVEATIEPARDDRRFNDPEWSENLIYKFIKQSYLLQSRSVLNVVNGVEGLEDHTRQQVDFYTRQLVNAHSPSNSLFTNPEVIRRTVETRGQNLLKGMKQLSNDMKQSAEGLNVTMTDVSAFTLGENVATTPGQVVFQNKLIQLIQYQPTTEKQYKTPLLIVPPWINKFYILDLRESNSLVKWLTDQGHSVFIISWVNPGPEMRDYGWSEYMNQGTLAAMDAVKEQTGEADVNLLSYCIGGTLTASTVAYLAATKQEKRVKSVTYMATLQDFSDPGEISVFINEASLRGMEKQLDTTGYLDGRVMAFSFNLLRENDLFWSFYINNYLKGDRPAAFDLLYWNTDGTNMPAAMHKFYLRNMYQHNRLIQPGGIEVDGVKIDISKVKTPAYFVSTIQDHIAKWKSTYTGAQVHSGPVKFVLSGSGHIAGVVNPPNKVKYGYWTNDLIAETPDAWFAGADKHEGSWWSDWQEWVTSNKYADPANQVVARDPNKGKLKVIEAAPGSYVKLKITDVIAPKPEAANTDSPEDPAASKEKVATKPAAKKEAATKATQPTAKPKTTRAKTPKAK